MIISEFIKRIISSLILFPIITYIVFYESLLFKLLLLILLIVSLIEWIKLIRNTLLVLTGCIFITFSFFAVFQVAQIGSEFFYIILIICISTDIGGYLFGKIIGGPKLTKISPNKTFSGAIGSFLLPVIVFFILKNTQTILTFELKLNIPLILLLSLISQIGDLTVSYFKRLYNVKDTGKFIPGHGGLLDRIDGMLLVFPFIFLILQSDKINF